jgi:hypothetical protein
VFSRWDYWEYRRWRRRRRRRLAYLLAIAFLLVAGAAAHGLYLQKIEPELHLRHVDKIKITGTARIIRNEFPLRRGQLQETVYSWGEATVDGEPTVVVTTRGAEDSTMVSMRRLQ